MVAIPAGSFTMGAEKNNDEKPSHTVYIRSFLMGKTEVTQKLWIEVMGSNPSRFTVWGPDCPVESVSWDDVQQFITRLNQKAGQRYRLPSEAEWEYAARAGSTTEWSHGDIESKLSNYAWYDRNSGGKTQLVGQKLPNAFGLFDMHGNVWEWTQDCWHGNYTGAPTDGSAWVTNCDGNYRVLRGGSWSNSQANARSAYRYWNAPDVRYSFFGFRLARDQLAAGANETITKTQVATTTGSAAYKVDAAGLSLKEPIVYFDFDSFVIRADARPIIEVHARRLRSDSNLRVALEGHTDDRGVREYSMGLGQKRADAVRKALSLLGVSESQMEAVSFGKEKPAEPGNSETAMQENRRVEINYR
jgi:peptidoglycan-associated lipoprotein